MSSPDVRDPRTATPAPPPTGTGQTSPPLPADADLRALLARARRDDDAPLREVVHGFLALRQALGQVLDFLAAREGGAYIASAPALVRARALVTPGHAAPADGDASPLAVDAARDDGAAPERAAP